MNYVFASFLNKKNCPQRNIQWPSDYKLVLPLIKTVLKNSNAEIIIFHDNLQNVPNMPRCHFKQVDISQKFAVTVERWFHYLHEIKNNEKIENLFMVDSTDVLMLNNAFEAMKKNTLYCGSEYRWKVGDRWLKKRTKKFNIIDYNKIINENSNKTMLNAGIVGADRNTIITFLERLTSLHNIHSQDIILSLDMPIFNYTIFKFFKEFYETGSVVHTPYKDNITQSQSWWKHK